MERVGNTNAFRGAGELDVTPLLGRSPSPRAVGTADVLRGELIRRAHEVANKVADTAQVALPGVGTVPPEAKLFVHAIVEFAHDVLL